MTHLIMPSLDFSFVQQPLQQLDTNSMLDKTFNLFSTSSSTKRQKTDENNPRMSISSKSTMSSEDKQLQEIQRKREEKALEKQKHQQFFSKMKSSKVELTMKVISKKVLGKVKSARPVTKTQPFGKLFGLTQPKGPSCLQKKPKDKETVLSTEGRILQEIQSRIPFKARVFKKINASLTELKSTAQSEFEEGRKSAPPRIQFKEFKLATEVRMSQREPDSTLELEPAFKARKMPLFMKPSSP